MHLSVASVNIAIILLILLAYVVNISTPRKSNFSLYDLPANRGQEIERAQPATESLNTPMVSTPIQPIVPNPMPTAHRVYHQAVGILQQVWAPVGQSKARYVSHTPFLQD